MFVYDKGDGFYHCSSRCDIMEEDIIFFTKIE